MWMTCEAQSRICLSVKAGNEKNALKTNKRVPHHGFLRKQHLNDETEVTPTCRDNDGHGGLLNDGSDSWKGGKTTVVSPAVLLYRMREVKVSI